MPRLQARQDRQAGAGRGEQAECVTFFTYFRISLMKLFFEERELNRLAGKMQQGDARAADALYRKLSHKVFGFSMNRLGNPGAAEDLMQDIFLKLVERIGTFDRQRGTFSVWFWQLARNTAIDHFRAERDRSIVYADVGEEALAERALYEPHRAVEERWEHDRFREALRALLDDAERELFEMRFIAELSYKEMARLLGRSEGALRVAVNRIKHKIRHTLA